MGKARASVEREFAGISAITTQFDVSRSAIYKEAREGRLPLRKFGRKSLVRISDMRTLIESHPAK